MPSDDSPPRRPRPPAPPGCLTIRCRLDGPLVVELPPDAAPLGLSLRVTDHEGRSFPLPDGDRPLALCRCGGSARRPFCDGSHRTNGFHASDAAPPESAS